MSVASAIFFVATLVLAPRVLVWLPADAFTHPPRPRGWPYRVAKNVLGLALVGLGVVMLVLPGQGILTILIGVTLLDIPGRHALLLRILRQRRVHHHIDLMRARAGVPPLALPDPRGPAVRSHPETPQT